MREPGIEQLSVFSVRGHMTRRLGSIEELFAVKRDCEVTLIRIGFFFKSGPNIRPSIRVFVVGNNMCIRSLNGGVKCHGNSTGVVFGERNGPV